MQEGQLPSPSLLTAQEAINTVSNAVLPYGSTYPWMTAFIDRNKTAIASAIEQSTFGNLSDFEQTYPKATLKDQLHILKAYIEKQPLEGYNVIEITSFLKSFSEQIAQRDKQLETALYEEQRAKRAPLGLQLPRNLDAHFKKLDTIQILNHMETMAQALSEPDLSTFKNWIAQKRNAVGKNITLPDTPLGFCAKAFREFIRHEMDTVRNVIARPERSIQEPPQELRPFNENIFQKLKKSLSDLYTIGKLVVLPHRFVLLACTVGITLLQRTIETALNFIIPDNKIIKFLSNSLLIYIGFLFGISPLCNATLLDNLLIAIIAPAIWIIQFCASVKPIIVGLKLAILWTLFARNTFNRWCYPAAPGWAPVAVPPLPRAAPARPVEPVIDGPPLENRQRNQLIRLLFKETQDVAKLAEDNPDRQPLLDTINKEQSHLRNKERPYILTAFDIKLLAKKPTLEGFDGYQEAIAIEKGKTHLNIL